LIVEENAGMPENYRSIVVYEYQEKKKEIYKRTYIVFEFYIYTVLSIRFQKYFFVKEYQISTIQFRR
jgi:hypothetical protein